MKKKHLRNLSSSLSARIRTQNERGSITDGPISQAMLLYVLPLFASFLFQQMYNTVDLIVIGQFAGANALAGVGATGSLTNLLVGFFLGLSSGTSVVIAQYYGAGDREGVSETSHTSIALCLSGGTLLMILGITLCRPLLILMGTPDDILDMAVTYMRIYFAGIIPIMIYNFGSGILRAVGDSRRPFLYLLISSVVNVILDLLFVAMFRWGIAGVAWATVIAQAVSAVLVSINLLTVDDCYRIFVRRIRFYMNKLSQVVRIGLPSGLQSAVISLSNVVIQSQINTFGSSAVAGTAAAWRVDGLMMIPVQAFGIAMTTFSGQNLGAGKPARAKKSTLVAVAMSAGSSVALGLIVFFCAGPILRIFTDDQQVIADGLLFLQVLCVSRWIFATSEALSGTMRGAGYATYPMLVSVICMCVFRVIWIYSAMPFWHNIIIVYLSYPISWIITCLAMLAGYLKGNWIKKYRGAVKKQEPAD